MPSSLVHAPVHAPLVAWSRFTLVDCSADRVSKPRAEFGESTPPRDSVVLGTRIQHRDIRRTNLAVTFEGQEVRPIVLRERSLSDGPRGLERIDNLSPVQGSLQPLQGQTLARALSANEHGEVAIRNIDIRDLSEVTYPQTIGLGGKTFEACSCFFMSSPATDSFSTVP